MVTGEFLQALACILWTHCQCCHNLRPLDEALLSDITMPTLQSHCPVNLTAFDYKLFPPSPLHHSTRWPDSSLDLVVLLRYALDISVKTCCSHA